LVQQRSARMRLNQERQDLNVWLERLAHINPHGFIELSDVPPAELMLHILNVVSGQGGPIDAAKRARLCTAMAQPNFKAATLAGAWIVKIPRSNGHAFVCMRDKVAIKGRHDVTEVLPLALKKQRLTLWEGRFFCRAKTGPRSGQHFQSFSEATALSVLAHVKRNMSVLLQVRLYACKVCFKRQTVFSSETYHMHVSLTLYFELRRPIC